MNKKIIKKIASIFMLLAIMSTTLANPVMNIGQVVATTINQEEVSAVTVDDESTDTNSVSEVEASVPVITEPIEEVETAPVVSDDLQGKAVSDDSQDKVVSDNSKDNSGSVGSVTTTEATTSDDKTTASKAAATTSTASAADSTVAAKDDATTSAVASKTATNSSVSISPLAQDLCNDSNSEPPKFTEFVQQPGTNNFDVTYFGDEPANYSTTSLTVNLNFGNEKAAIATNSVADGDLDFVFDGLVHTDTLYLTPDEAIALANNMKQHGNDPINPVKYTVSFTHETIDGVSCTRTTDAEGFRSYVPVFPRPVITAARTCIAGEIQVNFNPDETKYPTGTQYKIFEDGVDITGPLSINTNYSNLLTGRSASSHSYYALIDVDGFANTASDAYNVTTLTSASGIFVEPPTIGDFSVEVVNNAIEPTFTNFSLNGYPSANVSIVVDGPGVSDTQSFVVTDFSDETPTPIAVQPGTYTVRLHIEYGGCAPIDSELYTIIIEDEENPETEYPAPTFVARKVCTNNQEIGLVTFTYGTPSESEQPADPSGPYPSYAKIILLDSSHNPVANVEPYPILTTPSINVSVPGSYYVSIDIDGDGMMEEGDPESSIITFEAEAIPVINLLKMSVVNNVITPEYKVSYAGTNDLTGTITINSSKLVNPIIIPILSGAFVVNNNKVLDAINNLEPGTYNATLDVDYGGCNVVAPMATSFIVPTATTPPPAEPPINEPPVNEPPVNEPPANEPPENEPPANEPPANEPPANEPPKLVYTGLENNFFESIVINIKEVILNII